MRITCTAPSVVSPANRERFHWVALQCAKKASLQPANLQAETNWLCKDRSGAFKKALTLRKPSFSAARVIDLRISCFAKPLTRWSGELPPWVVWAICWFNNRRKDTAVLPPPLPHKKGASLLACCIADSWNTFSPKRSKHKYEHAALVCVGGVAGCQFSRGGTKGTWPVQRQVYYDGGEPTK